MLFSDTQLIRLYSNGDTNEYDNERGRLQYRKKNLSRCHSVHHKCLTWTSLGLDMALLGYRCLTNCLSYGITFLGCDSMQICRCIETFCRNLLPPFSFSTLNTRVSRFLQNSYLLTKLNSETSHSSFNLITFSA
jgi:hypothetical protein